MALAGQFRDGQRTGKVLLKQAGRFPQDVGR